MSIFNNTAKATKIPLVESFDTEIESFNIIQEAEYESFETLVEFNKAMYIGMKENCDEIIEEGFKEFFEDAAKFFRNLAKKIIEFTKNAMKYFVSYIQDFSKFLKKNEDYLKSLNINFTYKGYEYTFPEAPVLTKVYEIVKSYYGNINKIDSMKYSDIVKMRDEFANESTKNKIRASILGVGTEVSQDNYSEASKKLFRNTENPINITVDKAYIEKIIKDYDNIKSLLNKTETKKTQIIKLLNDLEIFFNKKASVTYQNEQKVIKTSEIKYDDNDKFKRGSDINSSYDENKLKNLNIYFDYKFKEARFISNCVITVYLDKINAIKDNMTQYKSIIRQALTKKENTD